MSGFDMDFPVSSTDNFSDGHEISGDRPEWWSDDAIKGTWQDTYTARRRIFPDGQCEVSVIKEKYFLGPAITSTRAKRGESENREASEQASARRARKNVRLRCKSIGADRMVTLTFRQNITDRLVALKYWKAFVRRLSRVKAFQYVAVIEVQQRGAIHFHVAVHGRQSYALLRSIWQDILGKDEEGRQMGQVNVRDPHKFGFGAKGHHRLAAYISKYCGKQMDARDINEKRYFCSKGISIPEIESWRVDGVYNQLDAMLYAFSMVEGHTKEGMQTWCYAPLGICYIATGPGWDETCPF
jgi:hypothetical protein